MTSLKRWKPRSPLSSTGWEWRWKKGPYWGTIFTGLGRRLDPPHPTLLSSHSSSCSFSCPSSYSCSCSYSAPTHTLPLTLCLCLALALAGATPFWEHEDVGPRSAMPKGTATRPTRSWQSSVVSMSAAQRGPNGVTFGSNGCFGRNNAPISYSNGYM